MRAAAFCLFVLACAPRRDPMAMMREQQARETAMLGPMRLESSEPATREERERMQREKDAAWQRKIRAEQGPPELSPPKEDWCDTSRVERIEAMKAQINGWLELLKKHGDWIVKNCDVVDTRGILVTKERTPEGVVIRTRPVGEAAEVKCKGTRPRGLTDEDLKMVLFTDAETRVGENNAACAKSDAVAGVDFDIRATDIEAMKAMLAR